MNIDAIASTAKATPAAPAQSVNIVSASSFAVAGVPATQAPGGGQRTIQDPSVGFITQYLSANDSQIIAQAPSAITIAYLRSGLTADGVSKRDAAAKAIETNA